MTSDAAARAVRSERPLTVLAVDDDGLILMNTVAMLEDMGHRVLEARSGEAALALARANDDLGLLITDQSMNQMSGLDLAERLGAARPELPVILATGYDYTVRDVPGHIVILGKPFDAAALTEAIDAALGRAR